MQVESLSMQIEQQAQGYRYSLEPFLIADFLGPAEGNRLLDIGTGCCIIPLLLLRRQPHLKISAIEIQTSLHALAARNVQHNGLESNIELRHGDFLQADWAAESFDAIVSNPPFRKIRTGRINPNEEKAIARHEIALDLPSLIEKSAALLRPGGKLVLTYPTARLAEVLRGNARAGNPCVPPALRARHPQCGSQTVSHRGLCGTHQRPSRGTASVRLPRGWNLHPGNGTNLCIL